MEEKSSDGDDGKHSDVNSGHLFVFTNAKAGMSSVDRERINKVIWEASKKSAYVKHAQKQDEKVDQRIRAIKSSLKQTFNPSVKSILEKRADKMALEFEAQRLSLPPRICVVCDMDMFYAAVEIRDNPQLKDKPVAVGGMGMICTTNYIARAYGVRAAMPGFIGKKLCPGLVFVKPDFKKYSAVAEATRAVFRRYDPHCRALSLDEAYLDLTAHLRARAAAARRGGGGGGGGGQDEDKEMIAEQKKNIPIELSEMEALAETAVAEMRQKIFEATGLTASAGIATNFMLAKISSDMNKPNGQFKAPFCQGKILQFVRALPARKIPGIGKVTEKTLKALGIETCNDIYLNRAVLLHTFPPKSVKSLLCTSLGMSFSDIVEDKNETNQQEGRKSMSHERTFSSVSNPAELFSKCKELCGLLSQDLKREDLKAKKVTVKMKTVDFDVRTRDRQTSNFIDGADEIFEVASVLLRNELPLNLRLLGVRVCQFNSDLEAELPPNQKTILSFFDGHTSRTSFKNCDTPADTSMQSARPSASVVGAQVVVIDDDGDGHNDCNFINTGIWDDEIWQNQQQHENLKKVENDNEITPLAATPQTPENYKTDPTGNSQHLEQGTSASCGEDSKKMNVALKCPICGVECAGESDIMEDRYNILNQHIDECLNRKVIQQITMENQQHFPTASVLSGVSVHATAGSCSKDGDTSEVCLSKRRGKSNHHPHSTLVGQQRSSGDNYDDNSCNNAASTHSNSRPMLSSSEGFLKMQPRKKRKTKNKQGDEQLVIVQKNDRIDKYFATKIKLP